MTDVFKALADVSRRHLLDKLLDQDGLTQRQLCEELNMSRQAVTKHLGILQQANLVVCLQQGRQKHHYLNPVPIQEIVGRWVADYRRVQTNVLLELKHNLEQ